MANVGISSACLYPMETDRAVRELAEKGVKNIEVHFSTYSELDGEYLDNLRKIIDEYRINVNSVHPFYCFLESPMFFTCYNQMRFDDGIELYRRFFNAASEIGGKYLVFHGGQLSGVSRCTVSDDEYFNRYYKILQCGREFGVTLLHENVFGHSCESIDFCKKMINALGDNALFTFDTKQARRAGFDSLQFAEALAGHVRNIHISDYDSTHDCLLPGDGIENYQKLYNALANYSENACWTLEVYQDAFSNNLQLIQSAEYLANTLKQ